MKKFFAFAVVAVATLASCGGNSENKAADSTAVDSAAVVAPVVEEVVATVDSAAATLDSAATQAKAAVEVATK